MKDLLTPEYPLWLPQGSIRGLLALLITGGYLIGLVSDDIVVIILGFYFISRNLEGDITEKKTESGDIL